MGTLVLVLADGRLWRGQRSCLVSGGSAVSITASLISQVHTTIVRTRFTLLLRCPQVMFVLADLLVLVVIQGCRPNGVYNLTGVILRYYIHG